MEKEGKPLKKNKYVTTAVMLDSWAVQLRLRFMLRNHIYSTICLTKTINLDLNESDLALLKNKI